MSSNKKSVDKKSPETVKKTNNQKSRLVLLVIPFLLVGFAISFVVAQQFGDKDNKSIAANNNGKTIHNIDIKKDNKDPIDLIINKGESVQFNSKDGEQHQIVQGLHANTEHGTSSLDSGVFNGDEAYLLEFKKIGKYEFHDNYDHDYTISVIVYDPDQSREDTKLKL